MRANYPSIV